MEGTLKFKKFYDDAVIPEYKTGGASGFDFHAAHSAIIKPRETRIVWTGLGVEIPEGYEIQIRPRSGMSYKTGLRVANAPGTIDSDYRGEIGIIVYNTGNKTHNIELGQRVAQGVIAKVIQFDIVESDEDLSETERGEGGFGSTGK